MSVPSPIHGKSYLLLTTFRKNGVAVPTPVWFAEHHDKIYVMSRSDSGKIKRIRNNGEVRIAPCSMRGKVTGPEFAGSARILQADKWEEPRRAMRRKYWLMRLPVWSKQNVYLEIEAA